MKNIKELERMLANGKISRREFMVQTTALGTAAALSPLLLSGTAQAAEPSVPKIKVKQEVSVLHVLAPAWWGCRRYRLPSVEMGGAWADVHIGLTLILTM